MNLSIKNLFLLMGLLGAAQLNAMTPEDRKAREERVRKLRGQFTSNHAEEAEADQQSRTLSMLTKRKRRNHDDNDELGSKKPKHEKAIERETLPFIQDIDSDQLCKLSADGFYGDVQENKSLKSKCRNFFNDFSLEKREIEAEIKSRGLGDIMLPMYLYFVECMNLSGSQISHLAEHRYGEIITLMDGVNFTSHSVFGDIKIWSQAAGECLKTLSAHKKQINSVINLGKNLFSSCSCDKTIKIWDQNTGRCLRILEGHDNSVDLLIKLNSSLLCSCSSDEIIKIWNIDTGECLHTLKGHRSSILSMIQSMNGLLISCSADKTIRVWNLDTGECLLVLEGHTSAVRSLVELKNGNLASCSVDKTIRIWNQATGECLYILEGHTGAVCSLVELKNGNLVSYSEDKTIRIWNLDNGECLHVLEGHTDLINSLIALKNGLLVSASNDETIRVWNSNTGECLQILKEFNGRVISVIELKNGNLVFCVNQEIKNNYDTEYFLKIKKLNIYPEEISVQQVNLVLRLDELACNQDKIFLNKTLFKIFNSLPDYLKERYQQVVIV